MRQCRIGQQEEEFIHLFHAADEVELSAGKKLEGVGGRGVVQRVRKCVGEIVSRDGVRLNRQDARPDEFQGRFALAEDAGLGDFHRLLQGGDF